MRHSTLLLRIAGAAVAAVGAVNVALGLAALGPLQLLASPGVVAILIGAGALTMLVGFLVWRGSLPATATAATVAGILVAVQIFEIVGAPDRGGAIAGRMVLTLALALLLGVAYVDGRRRAAAPPPS